MKESGGKSESPAAVTWKRFKKVHTAVAGLVFITIAVLISLFCYVIMPDNTPNANQMDLSISTMKPGFKCRNLLITNPAASATPFFKGVFQGEPARYISIAVDTISLYADSVRFIRYGSTLYDDLAWESIHIAEVYSGSQDNYSVDGEHIYLKGPDGNVIETTLPGLMQSVLSERLVERTYYFGTDRFGRDMFSRMLAGTRVSLSVGFIAVFISLVIGISLGAIAGFFGGWIDAAVMWLINVIWSIPTLLLVIAITMALGKGFSQVFIAVGLTMWVEVARVVRGQVINLRDTEFVEAGQALGYRGSRVLRRHLLPNILGPVFVIAASNFASAILLEAGLSFLGMGAQPPTPSWGMMIKENYGYIVVDAAYLAVLPGIAIMSLVLAFTFIGNGLRDAFDERSASGINS
jgi:peptide/nickel transport system permease protein